jgi:hypothetical protein
MKQIFNWSILFVMSIIIFGSIAQSCSSEDELNTLSDVLLSDSKFALFEKEFAESLSSDKNIVKLTGFRIYNISEDEKDGFKKLVFEYGAEMRKMKTVVADDYSFFRVYFPLHTAIVE